jgi:hypothetical protein
MPPKHLVPLAGAKLM